MNGPTQKRKRSNANGNENKKKKKQESHRKGLKNLHGLMFGKEIVNRLNNRSIVSFARAYKHPELANRASAITPAMKKEIHDLVAMMFMCMVTDGVRWSPSRDLFKVLKQIANSRGPYRVSIKPDDNDVRVEGQRFLFDYSHVLHAVDFQFKLHGRTPIVATVFINRDMNYEKVVLLEVLRIPFSSDTHIPPSVYKMFYEEFDKAVSYMNSTSHHGRFRNILEYEGWEQYND